MKKNERLLRQQREREELQKEMAANKFGQNRDPPPRQIQQNPLQAHQADALKQEFMR